MLMSSVGSYASTSRILATVQPEWDSELMYLGDDMADNLPSSATDETNYTLAGEEADSAVLQGSADNYNWTSISNWNDLETGMVYGSILVTAGTKTGRFYLGPLTVWGPPLDAQWTISLTGENRIKVELDVTAFNIPAGHTVRARQTDDIDDLPDETQGITLVVADGIASTTFMYIMQPGDVRYVTLAGHAPDTSQKWVRPNDEEKTISRQSAPPQLSREGDEVTLDYTAENADYNLIITEPVYAAGTYTISAQELEDNQAIPIWNPVIALVDETFEVVNPGGFARESGVSLPTGEWWKDDGAGYEPTGITTDTYDDPLTGGWVQWRESCASASLSSNVVQSAEAPSYPFNPAVLTGDDGLTGVAMLPNTQAWGLVAVAKRQDVDSFMRLMCIGNSEELVLNCRPDRKLIGDITSPLLASGRTLTGTRTYTNDEWIIATLSINPSDGDIRMFTASVDDDNVVVKDWAQDGNTGAIIAPNDFDFSAMPLYLGRQADGSNRFIGLYEIFAFFGSAGAPDFTVSEDRQVIMHSTDGLTDPSTWAAAFGTPQALFRGPGMISNLGSGTDLTPDGDL